MFIPNYANSATRSSQVKRGNTRTYKKKKKRILTFSHTHTQKLTSKHVLLAETTSPTYTLIPCPPALSFSLWFVSEHERVLVNELGCGGLSPRTRFPPLSTENVPWLGSTSGWARKYIKAARHHLTALKHRFEVLRVLMITFKYLKASVLSSSLNLPFSQKLFCLNMDQTKSELKRGQEIRSNWVRSILIIPPVRQVRSSYIIGPLDSRQWSVKREKQSQDNMLGLGK